MGYHSLRTKSKAHTKMWPMLTIFNLSLKLYSEIELMKWYKTYLWRILEAVYDFINWTA